MSKRPQGIGPIRRVFPGQGSADAEHKELKEGLAKALAKARDLTKVSGMERFGFVDVKVIKARFTATSDHTSALTSSTTNVTMSAALLHRSTSALLR